jgi:hypothetical protein
LDIVEGSVNHYLAQLSRYSVFVVGLPTSEASLTVSGGMEKSIFAPSIFVKSVNQKFLMV